ncbi:hypothetical protein SAMN05216298_0256 [Glycomyces sambucus]|uniref:Lipoprotein n=1 Tax=Glycomyces sambucus TaxID=380244 RepID=A0A1G9CBX1_9ACTN|nr:hypothetical protein SAMN05216298_0256 [Glycomyces sambucus]
MRRWGGLACALAVCGGAVAGCGAGQRGDAAAAAAEAFVSALREGDGAAACAALATETAQGLAASEGAPCEEAIGALGLPDAAPSAVDVWSDRAQVRTRDDVLFLAEFEDGWKVVAAGCRPQGERPYECEVGA